jgi:hypothetical protein
MQSALTPTTAQRWAVARLDDYGSKGSNEKITRSVRSGGLILLAFFYHRQRPFAPLEIYNKI